MACWLATQAQGFQVVVSALSTRLGLGKEKWQRIARQLEESGYLSRSCSPTGPGGRWVWTTLFFADASAHSTPTGADPTGAGFPGSGAPGDGSDGNKRRRQDQKNKQEEHKQAKEKERKAARGRADKFQIDQKTGIQHNPHDHRDQQALLAILKHPTGAVEDAANLAKALDDLGRAFPSAVLRILLKGKGHSAESLVVPRTTLGMDFSKKTYAREPI